MSLAQSQIDLPSKIVKTETKSSAALFTALNIKALNSKGHSVPDPVGSVTDVQAILDAS